MIPDLTNAHGIAALFVTTVTQHQQGMNYVLAADGTGLMVENDAGGGVWRAFTALPDGVDIADVAFWTPFTLYTHDGAWYLRSTSSGTWLAAATGSETRPETVPPQKPDGLLPQE